jgi:hypothetical protein
MESFIKDASVNRLFIVPFKDELVAQNSPPDDIKRKSIAFLKISSPKDSEDLEQHLISVTRPHTVPPGHALRQCGYPNGNADASHCRRSICNRACLKSSTCYSRKSSSRS